METNKIEQQIDKYVSDWCWNNEAGDIDWDSNVYSHVLKGVEITQKQIKDRLNELKSKLKEECQPKLNKVLDELKITNLEIRIDELEQLLNRK